LAEHLSKECDWPSRYASAVNFGPTLESNRSVQCLIETVLQYWIGIWKNISSHDGPYEASRLQLQLDKAKQQLGWSPSWSFSITVEGTVGWYRSIHKGGNALNCYLDDLKANENACNAS